MSFSSFELLDHSKPILVFGSHGQVGKALQVCLQDLNMPVVFLDRSDCDLANEISIIESLNRYQPQVIINAAAYTAVEQAETEPELVFAINAKAPEVMAQYIANLSHGILVHYSTDYVFSGTSKTVYLETDLTGPVENLSIYGQSKLAGEEAIQKVFSSVNGSDCASYKDRFSRYFILRTSWVYGDGANFIRTILRLAAEREQLEVVFDQVGTPTSAQWLAEIAIQIAGSRVESGIYHAIPDGETSWHGLAVFAIETAALAGEGVELKSENISAVSARNYPLSAKRPYNSRMNNQKLKNALSKMSFTGLYPHWQEQVEMYVKEYVTATLKS